MVQRTVEERAAEGRAARTRAPRSGFSGWQPAADRADPVGLLEQQAASRVPTPGAAALRPDGGVGVHLLPGRRSADGPRPGADAPHRPDRAALRRRPPLELRAVRRTRSTQRVQPERLRRDVARAVRMGRRTPGGQLRRRRARSRLHRQRACHRRHRPACGSYRESMREFGASGRLDLWYRRLDVDDIGAQFAQGATKKPGRRVPQDGRQVAIARPDGCAQQADPCGRRQTPLRQHAAAHRADRGAGDRVSRRSGSTRRSTT